jgi:hypothetical protein
MKSNVIFVMFHTRLQSADFVVLVVVLVLVPRPLYSPDFEDEYEYEKNQIKSHAYTSCALSLIRNIVSFSIWPAAALTPDTISYLQTVVKKKVLSA